MKRTVPTFFIVGSPKAGTDALYYDLDQHPEIYMSPLKEPCYFASEIRLPNFEPALQERMRIEAQEVREYIAGPMTGKRFGGIVSEWDEYLQLFSRVNKEKAIGEGSVSYLWSKTAADSIAARAPGAKIIMVLMDPAKRAFAQYLKSVSDGTVEWSFRKHVEVCCRNNNDHLGVEHPFLEFGMYSQQVKRYLNAFPETQIHISFYEEIESDRRAWFARILEFLQVDASFVPEGGRGHYHPNVPKLVGITRRLQRGESWGTLGHCIPHGLRPVIKKLIYRNTEAIVMNAEDREALVEYYRNDVHALEVLLKKDLSHWLAI